MNHIAKAVRDHIIKVYLQEGDQREITETTPLISSGLVDSLAMVSLRRFLEEKYDIHIPDSAATPAAFETIERIVDLVRRFQVAQFQRI